MERITTKSQHIVVYKINPNDREINGEVDFDRNVDGRIFYGNIYISGDNLIVKDDEEIVVGIFSLQYFYFLKTKNY